MVPVIETERLRMRGHRLEDFETHAAIWAHPDVTRFIGGKPLAREDSWRRFMGFPGHWALLGHGYWLVEEKHTGKYVGDCGFGSFKRDVGAHDFTAPEQGWALSPDMHGRGYATEACLAQIAWAESHFRRSDFICMIAPQNTPSLRVAQRLGYREFARVDYKGEESILFRRA